jgi:hypothetical protein
VRVRHVRAERHQLARRTARPGEERLPCHIAAAQWQPQGRLCAVGRQHNGEGRSSVLDTRVQRQGLAAA